MSSAETTPSPAKKKSPPRKRTSWTKLQAIATWFAIAMNVLLTLGLTLGLRYFDDRKKTDERTAHVELNDEVDNRLAFKLHELKLDEVPSELQKLSEQVSKLQGQVEQQNIDLQRVKKLQLNNLNTDLQAIEASKVKLDPQTIVHLGDAIFDAAPVDNSKMATLTWKIASQVLSLHSFNVQVPKNVLAHIKPPDPLQDCLTTSKTRTSFTAADL
jgi:hypothetical protein